MAGIEKKAAKQTSCGGKLLLCRGKRMKSVRRHQPWPALGQALAKTSG